MVDLKRVLTDITKVIVDSPDEVNVTGKTRGNNVMLELHVAEDDLGKVIGRHGKIARSIRLVMKAAASTVGKTVNVEIK